MRIEQADKPFKNPPFGGFLNTFTLNLWWCTTIIANTI
ncbi:hypothetical protein BMB171_C3192 [Bacillus thuringiensis BMB171]|nr:hypothetical protein BMB171_C3192 [Bacillus thuringiensis BMB171]